MVNVQTQWWFCNVGVPAIAIVLWMLDGYSWLPEVPFLGTRNMVGIFAIGCLIYAGFKLRPNKIDQYRMELQLNSMLTVLGFDRSEDTKVRIMMLSPDKKKRKLKAVTRLMPDFGEPELNSVLIHQGIVGAAFRTKEAKIFILDSDASVLNFGGSKKERLLLSIRK